jgi:hypothetical protein
VNRANVELHIEELVLRGFAPGDRYRIAGAVERQLVHLLATGGVGPPLAQDGEVAHVDGGAFDVAPGSSAETVGGQVAQAVYGGLKK